MTRLNLALIFLYASLHLLALFSHKTTPYNKEEPSADRLAIQLKCSTRLRGLQSSLLLQTARNSQQRRMLMATTHTQASRRPLPHQYL